MRERKEGIRMKDKFRVIFKGDGWIIQHSKLGIIWKKVVNFTWFTKLGAEKRCEDYRNGIGFSE
jgi:hypothetical protein